MLAAGLVLTGVGVLTPVGCPRAIRTDGEQLERVDEAISRSQLPNAPPDRSNAACAQAQVGVAQTPCTRAKSLSIHI